MHHLALPTLCLALGFLASPTTRGVYRDIDYNLDSAGPRTPYVNSAVLPEANWLDIYTLGSAGDMLPVVVYVHGGGWQTGDKDRTHFKDELFMNAGYVFVSVNYRLCPLPTDMSFPSNRVRSPMHVRDVAESIRWIQDRIHRYGGDGTQITLLGHSAGAQIVALLATEPSYLAARGVSTKTIRGVVPLDTAAFEVAMSIANAANPNSKEQAFGTAAENMVSNSWTRFSATTYVDDNDPPFFFVTQAQRPTRYAQQELMAIGLGQDPLTSILEVSKTHAEINHDLGDPLDSSPMTAQVLAFVNSVNR